MSVILAKDIDIRKIRFSNIKTLQSGAKTVYMNYDGGRLTVQTPVMTCPYGISTGYNNEQNPNAEKKYEVNLSFRGMEENKKIETFYKKMKEIEDIIVDTVFENRVEWLSDDYDGMKKIVEKMLSPIVKVSKDKETKKPTDKYPPTFKVKLPHNKNTEKFEFQCLDMSGNEIDMDKILTASKGSRSQLIVQMTGIWFAGGKYGCTWKAIKAKFELPQSFQLAFVEDSDTEKQDAGNDEEDDDYLVADALDQMKKKGTDTKKTAPSKAKEIVESSEEENGDEEVVEKSAPVATAATNAQKDSESGSDEDEEIVVAPPPPSKKSSKKK
jgi:hypothetical protein